MRSLLIPLLAAASLAGASTTAPSVPRCADLATPTAACRPTKQDAKQAQREFDHGMKLVDSGKPRDAISHFDQAAKLVPQKVDYITAREISKQRAVLETLQSANDLMLNGKKIEALAAYRTALEIDPQNAFALERLKAAVDTTPLPPIKEAKLVEDSPEIRVQPAPGTRKIHFRGDSKAMLQQVAKAFGIDVLFDESVLSRRVRFDFEDGNYDAAMTAATRMTRTLPVALSSKQIYLVNNDANHRREFERMSMRSFYVPDAVTPQELTDLLTTLRTLFEIRFITQSASASTITLRAPQRTLEAATRFMESLSLGRPQVMFDIKAYEVSHSTVRQLGVDLPLQFQVFNVPTEAQKLLGGRSIQDIIDQLRNSGSLTNVNSTAVGALLAQFLSGTQSSVLQQPFATFGGGITLFGVTIPGTTARLNFNESKVSNLEHVMLRASQANPAVMKIGTRFPIITGSYSSVYNLSSVSQLTGGAGVNPIPSFNYEDLGVNLKATPRIRRTGDVTVEFELQIRSLSAQTLNGVPVISNREYKGAISVKDGESAVLAGMVSESEQNSVSGLPLLSQIPVAGRAVSSQNKQVTENELLIVVTPRILNAPEREAGELIPLPSSPTP